MNKLKVIFTVCVLIHSVFGNYNGPFVLWGREQLSNIKSTSLDEFDERNLVDLYYDSSAIIIFIRNISTKITNDNFPIFKDLLSKTEHTYITHHKLDFDPLEYNLNAEVNIFNINFYSSGNYSNFMETGG